MMRLLRPLKRRREQGSALPLVAVALALLMMMVIVLAGISERVRDRAGAQAAADAAALAGAIEGEAGAGDYAAANGANLVSFVREGNLVIVVVDLDGTRAQARAERRLVPRSVPGGDLRGG